MKLKGTLQRRVLIAIISVAAVLTVGLLYSPFSPRSYDPPEPTNWKPLGPRTPPFIGAADAAAGADVLGNPASFFRALHGDSLNSDEVVIATAPVLEAHWVAEPHTFNPEGPSFDRAGNLYFSPLFSPGEEVLMISLEPENGSRRWVVEGKSSGTGTPLVLDDPDRPGEQVIYVGAYDQAMAVRPDADTNQDGVIQVGEREWTASTGLTVAAGERAPHIFGLNYDPGTDALIGLARDNHIYVLDRGSGTSLLSAPYSLPDIAPSPASSRELSPFILKRLAKVVKPILGDISLESFVDTLLGNNTLVANYFSVDPHTGRIWVAATAPDAEDGKADGISELGAIYCLKLVSAEDGKYTIEKLFHISFEGGSASTPALSADGKRVYVGDNYGKLLAIDASDGSIEWEFDVGEQVVGSVSVASDNSELYLPTETSVVKLIDHGSSATKAWQAKFDMYPQIPGVTENRRSLTATISANGIAVMGASEVLFGRGLTLSTGVGLLDRETGELRYFTQGREDSVAVTSLGPDGSVYIAHSPAKRLFSSALFGDMVPSITGGIQKYAAKRVDLLIRDALHASVDRAENVIVNGENWAPELKFVEAKQIMALVRQCQTSSAKALESTDLSHDQWQAIESHLQSVESALDALDFATARSALEAATQLL